MTNREPFMDTPHQDIVSAVERFAGAIIEDRLVLI